MEDKPQSIKRDGIVVEKIPCSSYEMTEVKISDGNEEFYARARNILDSDHNSMFSDTVVSMVKELVQHDLVIVFIDNQGVELECDLNGEWETEYNLDGIFGDHFVRFTDEAHVCNTTPQPVEDDSRYDSGWVFGSVDVREWP